MQAFFSKIRTVQGNQKTSAAGAAFEDFYQIDSNVKTLWRKPRCFSDSDFPEQELKPMAARLFVSMDHETWIYLIKDNDSGYYKIGNSVKPLDRFNTFKKQGTLLPKPCDFVLIEAWRGRVSDEHYLHTEFKNFRRRGEWFELIEKQVKEIFSIFFEKIRLSTMQSDFDALVEKDTARKLELQNHQWTF